MFDLSYGLYAICFSLNIFLKDLIISSSVSNLYLLNLFLMFSLSDFLSLSKLISCFFDKSLDTFLILSISLLSLLCLNKFSKYSNVLISSFYHDFE